MVNSHKDITIDENDTIDTLITKINASNDGQVKASFSDMTGTFTIQGTKTGESSTFKIEPPDALTSLSDRWNNKKEVTHL